MAISAQNLIRSLLVICGICLTGCGKKSPEPGPKSSKRSGNSLESLVVKNVGNSDPASPPAGDPRSNVPALTTTKDNDSNIPRSVLKRGDKEILIEIVDTGAKPIRKQVIVFNGSPLCSMKLGVDGPIYYVHQSPVKVQTIDCNKDGRDDFLFLTDASQRMFEGFFFGKDRMFVPLRSDVLYGENGVRTIDGVIKLYETQLQEAVKARKLNVVKDLLGMGISPNVRDSEGNALLHLAAGGGDPKLVETLLQAGASRKTVDRHGLTPYHHAVGRKNKRVIHLLRSLENKPIYLADMKPQSAKVGWGNFARYHSESSGVSIAGRHFKTGFYAHANSSIKYALDGNYERFTTSFGLTTGAGGVAEFLILVDGKLKSKSGHMYSRGGSVRHGHVGVSLDITGAKLLELKALGVRGCNGSHSAWGDPRLHKGEKTLLSDSFAFPAADDDLVGILLLGPSKVASVEVTRVNLWDVSTPAPALTMNYPFGSGRRNLVAWLGKTQTIAVANRGKIELKTIKQDETLTSESWDLPSSVSCMAAPKWRSYLLVGTIDRQLYLWNPSEKKVIWKRSKLPTRPTCIAYCALKNEIAVGLSDGRCVILEAGTGDFVKELKGHTFSIKHLCYSPSGQALITFGNDLVATIWDTDDYSVRGKFTGHGGLAKGAGFLTEDVVLSVDTGSDALIWNARTMKVIWRLPAPEMPQDILVDRKSKRLYICGKKELVSYRYHPDAL